MDNEGTLSLRQLVEAVTAEAIWRQEERLRALEARVDSLEEAIHRALETVFPRVDALVSQLEKQGSCPTRGMRKQEPVNECLQHTCLRVKSSENLQNKREENYNYVVLDKSGKFISETKWPMYVKYMLID